MKYLLYRLDPYKQSFFYFNWTFFSILALAGLCMWMSVNWQSEWVKIILDNRFAYFINYLTHEMAGHNMVGRCLWLVLNSINPSWAMHPIGEGLTIFLSGNAVETLLPFGLCLGALRLEGGRYLLPPLTYWLGTTFYGAGVYANDASACSLPLTSSDLITNYAPGEMCGDWHYVLEPLGLLSYDHLIGMTFIVLGCFCALITVWSVYEYWFHADKYLLNPQYSKF